MKPTRRTILGVAGVTSAYALFGRALPARADNRISLTLDWSPYGVHAPVFLAAQKGWFKEAGLDVTIQDGKGSTTTIQLAAAGTTNVAFAQLASMVGAIDNGLDVTSISGYIRAGDNGFIVPSDSPIKEAKDLIGKRIAYPLGGGSASLLDALWKSAGLKKEQMTLVGVDASAIASTYISGNVDAAVSPVAALMPIVAEKRPSRSIPYAQFGLRVPGCGLIVRRSEIASRAADLAKLVPVLSRSWKYVIDGYVEEGVDAIIAQRPNAKLDRAVLVAQMRENLKLIMTPATEGKPIGWQAESDWAAAIAALKSAGAVKNEKPIATYFTNQFIATS